ncbi:MAG: DUF72 domain-containing protein [Proteobacteria bacterium]|nr:DUF72 domain-containing protein [Pseudomonadota bacterium]
MKQFTQNANCFIGTSGWTYEDWAGAFYPKELPKSKWLEYYASQFNTVELNATFYRSFPQKTYESWYKRTPDNFHFVVKISRFISHIKKLVDVEESIQKAQQSAHGLKEKLGLFLLQLPPKIGYNKELLISTLAAFSDPSQLVVEFRNAQWFNPETYSILKKFNCIACNIDSPHLRIYDWVTSDIAYLRLHGHTKMYAYDYDRRQLNKITDILDGLKKKGAKKIYVFFNNDHFACAPKNAAKLKKIYCQSV